LPQLDVNASAGVIGYASDGARANRQMFDFKSYTLQASLVFHEPLARRAERGAHEAALAELRKDRLEAHASQAQLETAAVNTLALVESARDRAQGLARGVDFAESDLAAERARFLSGRSSTFDVLRKQQVLLDARLRLLRARIDFAQAQAELDALTGDIFCHGGVSRRACEP
jgi:outer membrane protein TolC